MFSKTPWYFWQLKFSFCSSYQKTAALTFSQMSLKPRWENLSVNILEPWNMLNTHARRVKIVTKGHRCRCCLFKSGHVYWMVGRIFTLQGLWFPASFFLWPHQLGQVFWRSAHQTLMLASAWMLHLFPFLHLGVDSSCLMVIICRVTGRLQDEFQVIKTSIRKPKVHLHTRETLFLKAIFPKCKFLFPALGSFTIPHRLGKVSPCHLISPS